MTIEEAGIIYWIAVREVEKLGRMLDQGYLAPPDAYVVSEERSMWLRQLTAAKARLVEYADGQ